MERGEGGGMKGSDGSSLRPGVHGLHGVICKEAFDDFTTEPRFLPGSLPSYTPEGSPGEQSWGSQFVWGEKI